MSKEKLLLQKLEVLNREILSEIDKQEVILNELELIRSEYEILQKKYKAISESKLGKVTLRYWNLKKILKMREK